MRSVFRCWFEETRYQPDVEHGRDELLQVSGISALLIRPAARRAAEDQPSVDGQHEQVQGRRHLKLIDAGSKCTARPRTCCECSWFVSKMTCVANRVS